MRPAAGRAFKWHEGLVRRAVFDLAAAQGFRCYYCGVNLDLIKRARRHPPRDVPNAATREHIWPRPLRPENSSGPLVAACSWCNNGWASLVDQWIIKEFT